MLEDDKIGPGDKGATSGDLPNLRTYKQDVADTVRAEGVTTATVVIAKQKREYQQNVQAKQETHTGKKFMFGIIVTLTLGVLVVAYFFFVYSKSLEKEEGALVPTSEVLQPSLIHVETRTTIQAKPTPIDNYLEIARTVKTGGQNPNSMQELILTDTVGINKKILNAQEFFSTIGLSVNDRLSRFLAKQYMLAIYSFKETSAFLIFLPISYGPVFAEMLEWEENLPTALYPLLAGKNLPADILTYSWEDRVIRNIDARVLTNEQGNVLMLYAFLPSKEQLIISTNTATLLEVLVRLQTPANVSQ